MPGPVIRNIIPEWFRPEAAKNDPPQEWLRPDADPAFNRDDYWTRVLRRIGTLTGANDPNQVMAIAGAMTVPGGEASPVQAGLKYLEGKFPKLAGYIKAYHGSPHDFEPKPGHPLGQFDMSKVGTGEGAQAYGHGLYFAEREGVAREYKNALQTPTVEMLGEVHTSPSWDANLPPKPRLIRRLADNRAMHPDEPEQAIIDQARRSIQFELGGKYTDDATRKSLQQELDILATAEQHGIKTSPGGHTYEVSINAHPDAFLDWDKPLSQQPQHIQEAVKAARDKAMGDVRPVRLKDGSYGLTRINPDGSGNVIPGVSGATPEEAIAAHQKEVGYGSGQWAYDMLSRTVRKAGAFPELSIPDKAAAAQALREAGIPGIKYLDQGSRGTKSIVVGLTRKSDGALVAEKAFTSQPEATAYAQEMAAKGMETSIKDVGTRNYVVFDDSLIDIMRKYGVVLPLGAGLAALSQQGQATEAAK